MRVFRAGACGGRQQRETCTTVTQVPPLARDGTKHQRRPPGCHHTATWSAGQAEQQKSLAHTLAPRMHSNQHPAGCWACTQNCILLADGTHTQDCMPSSRSACPQNCILLLLRLTSSALRRISGRGSNVSSDSPASSGNQKYTCSSRSTNLSDPGCCCCSCCTPPPPAASGRSSALGLRTAAAAASCCCCWSTGTCAPPRSNQRPCRVQPAPSVTQPRTRMRGDCYPACAVVAGSKGCSHKQNAPAALRQSFQAPAPAPPPAGPQWTPRPGGRRRSAGRR